MSLFTSLLNTFDKSSTGAIAGALGQSEQSVLRGMESSIAAVLAVMATKSGDPNTLRKTLDLIPSTSGDVSWSGVASGFFDRNSPLISAGERVLSGLFGTSGRAITSAISTESGLRPDQTYTLMVMAVPVVLSFLRKRVRDEGMNMGSLGGLLEREVPALRSALPTGLSDLFWPRSSMASAASPVVAQTVEKERSSARWILPIALLALIPALIWLFSHARRSTTVQIAPMATGTASRTVTDSSEIAKRKLPDDVALRFDTASARLRPESQELLNNVATMLKADPGFRAKVGGYTDNVGEAERNLELSQRRANTIEAELVHRGISQDRIIAKGYGEQYPIGDNSTEEGRASNRRVSISFAEK
jgi:outer membrane protein OmpA-like peptidoglycan-associated protein